MKNTKSRKHGFSLALLIMLLGSLFVISSCGGGGGGGGGAGGGGISYNGVTTQASITAANANKIFAAVWNGGSSSGSASLSPAISKASSSKYLKDTGMVALFKRVKDRSLSDFKDFAARSKDIIRATAVNETYYGVTGTLTITGSIDPNTMTGSLTMTYTNYNDGDGYTYDGTVTVKVDGYDMTYGIITDATMSFTLWTIKTSNSDISLSGSMRIQESLQNNRDILTVNMDMCDNFTNDTYRYENFVVTYVYDNILYPSSGSETNSGRVYIGPYGYVDVTTTTPLTYATYSQEDPNSGGPIILSGAGNSKAAITPISTSYVKIEVDADGDGVYESQDTYAWSNLNGDPVDFTAIPPSAPTGFTAAWGDRQVVLSWNASAGATSYNVYDTMGISSLIASPTGTSYTVTGLTNGGYYCYQVSAVNAAGESGRSMSQCGYPNVAPPAPTGVSAAAGDGQVVVSWTPISDISINYYYIYWSTSPGVTKSSPNRIQVYGSYNNTYTHTGRTNGTTYYYVVTAANTIESAESAEVSAKPQAGSVAPTTLDAGNVKDTSAMLNGSILNPSGYTTEAWFEYGTSTAYGNSTTHSAYAYSGAISLNADLSNLTENTTYHYRVVAQNSAGTFFGNDKTFKTLKTPLVVYSGNVYAYVSDGATIFWNDGGNLKYAPTSGGTAATLATGFSSNSMAVDATNVYSADTSTLIKIDRASGEVTTLASGLSNPASLAVDATDVYWVENNAVRKVNISGAPAVTDIATGLNYARALAIDSSNIYLIDNGGIKKIPKSGGTITSLSPSTGYDIAVDPGNIYWRDYGIKKMGLSGGSITTLVGSYVYSFAVDATDIYFSDWSSVRRMSINGGPVTTLCNSSDTAYNLTVDATNVYWRSWSGLYKVAK